MNINNLKMFQSLSGLTLCCDTLGRRARRTVSDEFQSLSGLTLCCDREKIRR